MVPDLRECTAYGGEELGRNGEYESADNRGDDAD